MNPPILYKSRAYISFNAKFELVLAVATVSVDIFNTEHLSYEVAPESEITPCNKIDKPLVVYRFTGNVMTSITILRTNRLKVTKL